MSEEAFIEYKISSSVDTILSIQIQFNLFILHSTHSLPLVRPIDIDCPDCRDARPFILIGNGDGLGTDGDGWGRTSITRANMN